MFRRMRSSDKPAIVGSAGEVIAPEQGAEVCSWCRAVVPPESQFCPSCGEPVTVTSRAVAVTAASPAPAVYVERGRLRLAGDLRRRLLEAARRELGPDGDTILCDITELALNAPLEEITYTELPHLFIAVHQGAPALAGRDPARDLARALEALHAEEESAMHRRLLDGLAAFMGPAAEPFLVNVCAGIDLDVAQITVPQLPLVAAAVERAGAIFGPAHAASLGASVHTARAAPEIPGRAVAVAISHIGPEGESLIREICRERLGKDLDAIEIDDLAPLTAAVADDAPARIGAMCTSAFITAARFAVVNPTRPVRAPLVQAVNRELGPAGEIFLRKACTKNGLPFEAICSEHLPWLAQVLRQEAAPLLGEAGAERLAQGVRSLQPEPA
jgi:hypothetical protein